MENVEETPTEDLAQLLVALKSEYDVKEPEIASRIGVHVSTVNNWVNRKRAGKRGPNKDKLRALHAAFPKFSEERIFAAASREVPGPLSADAKERLLALFGELTEDQQELQEIQMRAIVERNHSGRS
ncbi:helix-turn-helix domain-containing protein [Streptomyces scopuliridis]|uniref:helix-turn-helix domain-containing protein n=1 Tax=Streptomyces scopuliridis TaxID=452529 RepID=UPI0036AEB19D